MYVTHQKSSSINFLSISSKSSIILSRKDLSRSQGVVKPEPPSLSSILSSSLQDNLNSLYTATHDISFMQDSCATRSELTVVFLNTG